METINVNNTRYIVLAKYLINKISDPKKEKENYGADIVFKSGDKYFICNQIIEANFEDIK